MIKDSSSVYSGATRFLFSPVLVASFTRVQFSYDTSAVYRVSTNSCPWFLQTRVRIVNFENLDPNVINLPVQWSDEVSDSKISNSIEKTAWCQQTQNKEKINLSKQNLRLSSSLLFPIASFSTSQSNLRLHKKWNRRYKSCNTITNVSIKREREREGEGGREGAIDVNHSIIFSHA